MRGRIYKGDNYLTYDSLPVLAASMEISKSSVVNENVDFIKSAWADVDEAAS